MHLSHADQPGTATPTIGETLRSAPQAQRSSEAYERSSRRRPRPEPELVGVPPGRVLGCTVPTAVSPRWSRSRRTTPAHSTTTRSVATPTARKTLSHGAIAT